MIRIDERSPARDRRQGIAVGEKKTNRYSGIREVTMDNYGKTFVRARSE